MVTYQKIIIRAQNIEIELEAGTVTKERAKKSPGHGLQFKKSIIDIARDDCAELRTAHAKVWWRVSELEYVLQIWTQIRDALQSASNYLNQRRDALTSAAFASPDPTLTQQALTAHGHADAGVLIAAHLTKGTVAPCVCHIKCVVLIGACGIQQHV